MIILTPDQMMAKGRIEEFKEELNSVWWLPGFGGFALRFEVCTLRVFLV